MLARMTSGDDPLFARAQAAMTASRLLIEQAELARQTAKMVCADRLHLAIETARILRYAEQYMFWAAAGSRTARRELATIQTGAPELRCSSHLAGKQDRNVPASATQQRNAKPA
jgi:hypothetical protein